MNANNAVLNGRISHGGIIAVMLGVMLAMPALTNAAADPYPTTNGTWNVRAGVGTSIDNPALWLDEANWVDGKIPDGPELANADFRVGTSSDVIWVKLPDDRAVTVQKLLFAKGAARIRFFGGQGFNFNRTTGPTYIQLVKDKTSQDILAYAASDPGEDAPVFFTPIHCAKNEVRINNVALAGPVSFGFANKTQLYFQWYNLCRADRYAPCGGDTRVIMPNLSRVMAGELAVKAPQNNEAHTGSWAATKDSKMFRHVSGKTGTELAVGQYVHADGVIPEGTYVEYIYDDGHIGLSQAALADSADAEAGTSIAFDRCYYKLTQSIENWSFPQEGNFWSTVIVLRREEENVCTFDIKNITDGMIQKFWINSDASEIGKFPAPGILELRNAGAIGLKELRFSGASYLRLSGDSLAANAVSNLTFNTSAVWGTLDVPDGCEAMARITKVDTGNVLTKVGAGTLTVRPSPSVLTAGKFGSVTVSEGTFVFAPTGDIAVQTLTVEDGATLAFDGGSTVTVNVKLNVKSGGTVIWPTNAKLKLGRVNSATATLDVEPGAIVRIENGATVDGSEFPEGTVFPQGVTVAGTGTVANVSIARKCVFRDAVVLKPNGLKSDIGLTDTLSTNLPTRISPALWVSAKATDSFVYGNPDRPTLITQWNDCRGTPAEGYHFATNTMPDGFRTSNYFPALDNGMVLMPNNNTKVTSPANSPALVWDTPIHGIKAVFSVVMGTRGTYLPGAILGSTERLSTCDFYRRNVQKWDANRFNSPADNPLLWHAPYYINGRNQDGLVRAKPTLAGNFTQVIDVHPLGDGASADCWGYQWKSPQDYGAVVGECLIYTNAVTEVERRRIENYLMSKWLGSCVIAEEIIAPGQNLTDGRLNGTELNLGADNAVAFESYTGDDGFVKTGEGAVYVKGLQSSGEIRVLGGLLHVTSYDATTNSVIPPGAVLHLDANADASFADVEEAEGGQLVGTWKDADDAANPYSFQLYNQNGKYKTKPLRKTVSSAFARPMKVVDYGAFHNSNDPGWTKGVSTASWYGPEDQVIMHVLRKSGGTALTGLDVRSAFAVWGTAAGGNQVFGGKINEVSGDGYGLMRNYVASADVAENVAQPILAGANSDRATNPAATTYGSAQVARVYESMTLLNGTEVTAYETAPTGGYDVFSILTPYRAWCGSLGGYYATQKSGGMEMGELYLYDRTLSLEQAKRVDSYLNWKWFGRTPGPTCRPATLGTLEVAAGATVCVTGNAPLQVSTLSGAGTVEGAVVLMDHAVFEVQVKDDGSVDTLVVSGSIDLSKGGTVRFVGNVKQIAEGRHCLIKTTGLTVSPSAWDFTGYAGRRILELKTDANGLYLSVKSLGGIVIVR